MRSLIPYFPLIFVMIAVGSAHGTLSYLLARYIERLWPSFPLWLFGGLLVYVSCVGFPGIAVYLALLGFFFLFVPGMLGAYFHMRSGGASSQFLSAGVLLAGSLIINILPTFALAAWAAAKLPASLWLSPLGTILPLGAFYFPLIAPLGVWLWQNCQPRPGIDEPFETGIASPLH